MRPLKKAAATLAAMAQRNCDDRKMYLGEDAMTKKWVAFASFLLLSGAAAFADGWVEKFSVVDTDGSGTISRTEYEANIGKLKIDPVPTFTAIDADGNNSIDKDELVTAEKMVKAFPEACKSSKESWCPKQY